MKKVFVVLSLFMLTIAGTVVAQRTLLIMQNGSMKEGYMHSPFHSTIQHIDLSEEPMGEAVRYPMDDIDRVLLIGVEGDTTTFIKERRYRMFKSHKPEKKDKRYYRTPVLFRLAYQGADSVGLYVEDREVMLTSGQKTAPQKERWYYVRLKGEPALRIVGVTTAQDHPEAKERNFKMYAKQTFADYPEMVQRIVANEFSITDPVKLVKAYEKLIEEQQKKK